MTDESKSGSSAASKQSDAATKQGASRAQKARKASPRRSKAARAENKGGSRSTQAGFDKALEEVRQVREDNERRAQLHNRTVIERQIAATDKNGKEKMVDVRTADQRVFIDSHGEAVLDREGVIQLQQIAVAMSQAVS